MGEVFMFDYFKPFCVRAIQNPSKETFLELENVLLAHLQKDVDLLPPFQEYLCFPMKMVILQNSKFSESTLVSALKTLNIFLHLISIKNWEFFSKTFVQLFATLSNPQCEIKDNKFSDELKTEIIRCSRSLVSRTTNDIRMKMMNGEFCAPLGHSIFVLLWIAQNEKSRQLRITAMETVISLYDFDNSDTSLKVASGKRLAAFLPGICIAASDIATGDVKQGTAVTITSIKLWSFVVNLVLSDASLAISNDKIALCQEGKLKVPEIERTPEWVAETGTKLEILMKKFSTLVSHEKWKVRLAMLDWAENILINCTCSLEKHSHTALDIVIALNLDEYPEVSSKSMELFSKFSSIFSDIQKKDLAVQLEENIYALCTKLPRVFRVFDDIEKQSILNLLAGYIRLLGPKINCVLYSSSYIDRLMLALMQLVQFDASRVFILENKLPSQLEKIAQEALSADMVAWPKKYFKHFREDKVLLNFCNVCRRLGSVGNMALLVDYLLEKARSSTIYAKESIFILNEVVVGVMLTDSYEISEMTEHINRIIEEYLSDPLWNLDISETNTKIAKHSLKIQTKPLTSECIKNNIIQKCLLIEGFGKFSKILKKDFEILLLPVLCPLLEQIGSESLPISHTASLVLNEISNSCEYGSTSNLIFYNSDYLAHSLSVKLMHFESFPDAPIVLDIVFRLSEAKIFPLLKDLLEKVLQLLDIYHHERGLQLLKILQSLLAAIARWNFHNDCPKIEQAAPTPHDDMDRLNFKEFLIEYHRLNQVSSNLEDDMTNEDFNEDLLQEPQDEESEKNVKAKPLHIEMTVNVLKRCVHLQSTPNLATRILTQDLIQYGISILKQFEDELLPLAHELWNPLVRRFTNDDNIVTLKAFETLMILAKSCGDFIRKRVLTDVWAKLFSILEQQRLISCGKDDGSPYRFTIHYKLQLAILSNLGILFKMLDVREEKLELACSLAISYLTEKHPQSLLQAATATLEAAELVDPDLVWFCRRNYGGTDEPPLSPHDDLRQPQFPKTNRQSRKL